MSLVRRILAAAAAASVALLAACANGPADARDAIAVDVAAATTSGATTTFDPGYIVSDDSFYDTDAMNETQIQRFLERVDCRPKDHSPCLADYRQTTPTIPAAGVGHCTAYRGGARESAARIIRKAAVACGLNPRTLIVLLQKEQSLVTRPSASGYLRATGYGCPDTAACDAKYFGFFNQVYRAAWQFRQYTEHPDRTYRIGQVDVRFNPDPACGSRRVDIRDQATANLYNYTPYQPNAAVLADPETGDDCSAWGNLNFWRIWHGWFGDPTAERYPGFLPPCSRLIGGHACPSPVATIPAAPTGGDDGS